MKVSRHQDAIDAYAQAGKREEEIIALGGVTERRQYGLRHFAGHNADGDVRVLLKGTQVVYTAVTIRDDMNWTLLIESEAQ